jgi:hypothetical protein
MKNIKKALLISFILLSFYSCSNDEISDENTSENYKSDLCLTTNSTCCGTSGRFKVVAGKSYVYSVSTTINNPSVTWEIEGESIELISTNGLTATFKFNSNFTAGRIRSKVVSSSSSELCESTLDITKQ